MKLLHTRQDIRAGATWAVRLRREPLRVRCERGRLWVTLESEPSDFVLGAGESLVVQGPGRLVLLAVDDARVELGPAPRVTHLAA